MLLTITRDKLERHQYADRRRHYRERENARLMCYKEFEKEKRKDRQIYAERETDR